MVTSKLVNVWKSISHAGLNDTMSMSEQKKLILTNQSSILLFLFLTIYIVIYNIANEKFTPLILLLVWSILLVPYRNKHGYYRFTSFMISIMFPVNIIIFSSLLKYQFHSRVDIIYYIVPRLFILGGLVTPLILIDHKRKYALWIAIVINFLCLLFYDIASNLFGVGFNSVEISHGKYSLLNIYIILPYLLMLAGLVFLQNINTRYEEKVNELMLDLQDKNTELKNQKDYIEKIHNEITDSINYAERIQNAALPDPSFLSEHFSDSFILFLPRDIVSGDFYWFTKVGDTILVTVADCTGHGVPGGFMSMLGISSLREIVDKGNITDPSQILGKLRKEIISTLNQNVNKEHRDGLDISLFSLSISSQESSSRTVYDFKWAGANNPCWIIREGEFIELKANKMPIGIHETMGDFTVHNTLLYSGDIIYMASDGFKDQFGGPKSKKFMAQRLIETLQTNADRPMNEQQKVLMDTLYNWMNAYEEIHDQVDDITVLGVKL